MSLEVGVTSVTTSDGTTVEIPLAGVTVFVGPNNAGKSASLREIVSHLSTPHVNPYVIKQLQPHRIGTPAALETWLDEHCEKHERPQLQYSRVQAGPQTLDQLRAWWSSGPPFHALAGYFVFHAAAQGRLDSANNSQSFSLLTERPTHPLHYLYLDPALEQRLSDLARQAFGQGLVLNRFGGSQLSLHVGQPPLERPPSPPPREYLEALARLPVLPEQGDGMRSFVGLLLRTVTADYPIVLVDEPEAFLHPPQARLLGRLLVQEKAPSTQVFLATHDSDILRGVLDAERGEVTVVRLQREGDVNRTTVLEPDTVRELWQDPLLRYSNLLDGIFHQGLVLCESDADARFYASVLDGLDTEQPAEQLLFTHCGGKHRMPSVVRAMLTLGVPTVVVADFDILRDEVPLKPLTEAFGLGWGDIEGRWRILKAALDATGRSPTVTYVREEIDRRLAAAGEARVTPELERDVRELMRTDSGWDATKRGGLAAVPQGDARGAADSLIEVLAERGLFVVPVGELERWVPEVGGHGPAWVAEVHSRGLHRDESNSAPREFMRRVQQTAVPGVV